MSNNFKHLPIITGKNYKPAVNTAGDLPASGNVSGDIRYVIDVHAIYGFDGVNWNALTSTGGGGNSFTRVQPDIGTTPTAISPNDVLTITDPTGVIEVRGNSINDSIKLTLKATQDNILDGITNKQYTSTEKTKLGTIATNATQNSSDAVLENRANHTGTQLSSTISDFNAAVVAASPLTPDATTTTKGKVQLAGDLSGTADLPTVPALLNKVDKVAGKQLSTEDYTTAEKTKLAGIANGATSNSSDAVLENRSNHTGTQLSSTISNFNAAVLADPVTGLSPTPGSYSITDSIITTINKIIGNGIAFVGTKGQTNGLATLDGTTKVPTSQLPIFGGDIGTGGTVGVVPAPAAGDAAAGKYLKADGTWAIAGGGGGSTLTGLTGGSNQTALGTGQTIGSNNTVLIGSNSISGFSDTCIGSNAQTVNGFAIAIGSSTRANATGAISIGFRVLGANSSLMMGIGTGIIPAAPSGAIALGSEGYPYSDMHFGTGYSYSSAPSITESSIQPSQPTTALTDQPGLNMVVGAGKSTGAASSGYISLLTNNGSTTGSTLNTQVEAMRVTSDGMIQSKVAGKGFGVKSGSNCKIGKATLAAGTVTVANTSVTTSSIILLTAQSSTTGTLSIGSITSGTGFVINSSYLSDTTTVGYLIFEQV